MLLLRRRPLLVLALVLLSACARRPELALHQSVIVLGAGTTSERRVEIWEDARITPSLRALMWGGPKDPPAIMALAGPALTAADRASLDGGAFLRAVVRLVDRDGRPLAERRLDCELGQVAEPALAQGQGMVWGVGDDCSTGEGEFAGLITRFLKPDPDGLVFERFDDPSDAADGELTLVTARRILWHLVPKDQATSVREVASHPDYAAAPAKPAEAAAGPVPWARDLSRYDWDERAGRWTRRVAREPAPPWSRDDPWPDEAAFPGP